MKNAEALGLTENSELAATLPMLGVVRIVKPLGVILYRTSVALFDLFTCNISIRCKPCSIYYPIAYFCLASLVGKMGHMREVFCLMIYTLLPIHKNSSNLATPYI